MPRTRRPARLRLIELEARVTPAAPNPPVIIEPFVEGQVTNVFDVNLQTDPAQYSDPDGHIWQATAWEIRQTSNNQTVWQTAFLTDALALYRVNFNDGAFVGPLAGQNQLAYNTNYALRVRYRDSNNEVSTDAVRNFRTQGPTEPIPGAGTWIARQGYAVEQVATGLRLPVNIAFLPNPGPNPTDPLFYVSELYGSIQVVARNGTVSTFATGLLDYNPTGPISGNGEQGLTGIAVQRDAVNPNTVYLYVGMLWDNGSPPGGANHYPKVERLTSTNGGLTMASRTVLRNMQPETQGQSHQISAITLGPDGKLYVDMGDGFDASTALNLNQYRGKVLRMNTDGTAPTDNPFYNAADGISARDYVYTYGHRNPFGAAWRPANNRLYIVENGNSRDRLTDLVAGQSYGWSGNDTALDQFSKYVWNPASAPVNIAFVAGTVFGGSGYPASAQGSAFVSLSGSTYAAGPQARAKSIEQFTDLDTLNAQGKLVVPPTTLVRYNGTGRASVVGLAAGPDGLYFTDLYEDTGASGPTAAGSNVYRVRYVGTAGGLPPTVATAAAANPNPVVGGTTTALTVLGADDGGEPALTYTWGVQGTPPGGVLFSANGTNAAKNVTATFGANGTYNLFVAIRDVGGQVAISNVAVTVVSIPSGNGTGLPATYWDNINFTGTTVSRTDATINFDWGNGSPAAGIGADTFSARWTGFVLPRTTGTYTFLTTTDDGVRLWVNNQLIIDRFIDQGPTTHSGTIALTAGQAVAVRMDYYENGGGAVARLEWQSAGQPREIIPQSQLYAAQPPGVPQGPAAVPTGYTAGSTQAVPLGALVTWNAVPGATGYRVERRSGATGHTQVGTPAGTSFNDSGLAANTTYFYRVKAFNAAGDGLASAEVSVTTPALTPAPTNGTAGTVATEAITLTFTDTASNEDGFQVYRSTAGGSFVLIAALPANTVPAPSAVSWSDTGLTPGTRYDYRVLAFNLAGPSAVTAVATATRTLAPTNLTASSPQSGQAQLGWTAAAGAAGYNVYRGTSPNGQSATPVATNVQATSFLDTGLTNNTTYYYKVTALNAVGLESAQSNEASARPVPAPTVQSVVIPGGGQRSRVTEITVTFSGLVTLPQNRPDAFRLTRVGPGAPSGSPAGDVTLAVDVSGSTPTQTIARLTFTGALTEHGSLIDGNYTLTVLDTQVSGPGGALDGDNNGTPGGNHVAALYRLFGDEDADRDVDNINLLRLRSAFDTMVGHPAYLAAYDWDNDTDVDNIDLLRLRQRFDVTLAPPP